METENIKEIIDSYNATRIGRCIDNMNSQSGEEAFEDLYITDKGEYFLHGNFGVTDPEWIIGSGLFDKNTDQRDELVFIRSDQAWKWAARYLPVEDFSTHFGKINEYKKVLVALSEKDFLSLFKDAMDARSEGYSAEAFASDASISIKYELGYSGINIFAAFEFSRRLWHLWDEYDAPNNCD